VEFSENMERISILLTEITIESTLEVLEQELDAKSFIELIENLSFRSKQLEIVVYSNLSESNFCHLTEDEVIVSREK
jgi:hypothetical protein